MNHSLVFALPLVLLGLFSACGPAKAPDLPPAGGVSPPSTGVDTVPEPPPAGQDTSGDPAAEVHYRTVQPSISLPKEWTACSAEADCVLVEIRCCDHCNGGEAIAVNGAYRQQVIDKHAEKNCHAACTERGCMTRPFCEAGQCIHQWPVSAH